ncbi:MAG: BACON domain-containing protein [Muribaculaceae bacterium]|nr:BACON domain-containing protein [Muribaculaceae bacterium]
MKKFSFIFAMLMPLLFASCEFEETDLGFPDTVTFSADGGEMVISGDVTFNHAGIHNYKTGDNGSSWVTDAGTIMNEFEWLKIEYSEYNHGNNGELKIFAKPNSTGKTRYLHIAIYDGPDYQNVKVKQK